MILGGGFGGLRTALSLSRHVRPDECRITLVDRRDEHVNPAILYEVATAFHAAEREAVGKVLHETAAVPLTRVLDGSGVVFLERAVDLLDPVKREVRFTNGETLAADFLVIALGSQAATYGTPGVETNTFSIRTLPEALELRQHLVRQFFRYRIASRQRQRRAFRVVVVGGGLSGVELAAELVMFLRKLARLHHVDERLPEVSILEASEEILREFPPRLRARGRERLKALGVTVLLRHAASQVGAEYLTCRGDTVIPADTVVWLAGQRPHEVLLRSGLPVHPRGGVFVGRTLEVRGHPQVFGVGDCVYAQDPETGRTAPDVAPAAIRQGAVVAENIRRRLHGRAPISYLDQPRPLLATVGGKYALVHFPPFQFAGRFGWLLKELVALKYLLSILPNDVAFRLWLRTVRVSVRND